jgi:hypothetical protein
MGLRTAVADELGVRRPVALLRAEGAVMPMTWGVRRPVVLVPAHADRWSTARRRDVLRHELAHVVRRDWATQLVARVACAIHWFNPCVWLATRAMRAERERACDDRVLRAGSRPSDYATHLIELARAFRADAAPAALAMARPSRLAGRLLAVLDGRRRRAAMTGRQVAGSAAIALLAVIVVGTAAPVEAGSAAAGAAAPRASRADARVVADGSGPHARAAAEARATAAARAVSTASAGAAADVVSGLLADTLPECVGGAPPERRARSVHVNDGMAVSVTVGRCVLRFVAEGRVRFAEDYTDVAGIAPGGRVSLETDNGDVRRELELVPRGGALERRYRVDGAVRPYDADARRWVAGALTVMFRASGVAAEERARWILQRQGTEALIAELALLQGDYARRRYAQVLVASDGLDAAALARVLEWAGANIASDYELAQVLVTGARGPIDPAVQRAFVAAAGSLESDYEIGRVLSTALARADLDAEAAARALEIMEGMESDYELARLLVQWQRRRTIDGALRPVFFRAVSSLESDYERRRVLASVIGRRDASESMVADALAAMRGMESDYDVAELLTAVADLYPIAEALRPAFFAAVATLHSSYERRRALEAVVQRTDLAGAALLDVLRAAGEMPPGYDRAEVLIAVASRHRLDGAQHAAFLDAARGLSDYEYGRVMTARDRGRRVGI